MTEAARLYRRRNVDLKCDFFIFPFIFPSIADSLFCDLDDELPSDLVFSPPKLGQFISSKP